MVDSDDGSYSKRDSHFNEQRASLRSSLRSDRTFSRPQSSQIPEIPQDFTLLDVLDDRDEASPSPIVPTSRRQSRDKENVKGKRKSDRSSKTAASRRESSRQSPGPETRPKNIDEYLGLGEVAGQSSQNRALRQQDELEEEQQSFKEARRRPGQSSNRATPASRRGTPGQEPELTALPQNGNRNTPPPLNPYIASKPKSRQAASRVMTELYTLSYLILFSILGTLARLGLQWLTFYPGAPVIFSELWANVGGTLFLGFLSEDRRLFAQEWGTGAPIPEDPTQDRQPPDDEEKKMLAARQNRAKANNHGKVKKTLPLYIGLATGFCGSFTSFSSFIRDVFFALSNDMPSPVNHPYPPPGSPQPSTSSTVPRNGGYSFMALLAVIFMTISLCYSAFKVGQHIAFYTDRFVPSLPFHIFRRIIDPIMVFIAFGAWLGAVFMAIWPPDRPGGPSSRGPWENETWRGQAIFACVFAPVGCILRFYISLRLNTLIPAFPLGTFAVNVFGTAVLGMAYDLQHVSISGGGVGGGRVGCQVLQGIMDGFCGCLTTVSTWIAEIHALKRGHGYLYSGGSVVAALCVLIVIMGSVRWTEGWSPAACVT